MVYEYQCQGCAYEWEVSQPITATALTECPKCGAGKAKRLISGAPKFVLKGGGWFSDGYSKPVPK